MLPKYAVFFALPCESGYLEAAKYASKILPKFYRTGGFCPPPTPGSFAFRGDHRTTNGIIKKVTVKLM